MRSLAELHYQKARSYLTPDSSACTFIRILLESVALNEFSMSHHGGHSIAPKLLQESLEHLLETRKGLAVCQAELEQSDTSGTDTGEDDSETSTVDIDPMVLELKNLLPILESRLNNVLKDMTKFSSQRPGRNTDLVKRMYMVSLRGTTQTLGLVTKVDVKTKCKNLLKVLVEVANIREGYT